MWQHKRVIYDVLLAFYLRIVGINEQLERLPFYLKFQGICCWAKLVAMVIFIKSSVSGSAILNVATQMS